jgi:hypothetical protein
LLGRLARATTPEIPFDSVPNFLKMLSQRATEGEYDGSDKGRFR